MAFQRNFNIVSNTIFQTLKYIYTVWVKRILIMQHLEENLLQRTFNPKSSETNKNT